MVLKWFKWFKCTSVVVNHFVIVGGMEWIEGHRWPISQEVSIYFKTPISFSNLLFLQLKLNVLTITIKISFKRALKWYIICPDWLRNEWFRKRERERERVHRKVAEHKTRRERERMQHTVIKFMKNYYCKQSVLCNQIS